MEELQGALENPADFAVSRPKKAGVRTRNDDKTFGPYRTKTGELHVGVSEIKQEKSPDGSEWLVVDRRKYELIPRFSALLTQIHPTEYTGTDLENYAKLIAQTKAINNPGPNAVANPKSTCKYKNLLKDMGLDMSDDTSTETSPERQDDDVLFTPTRTSAGSGVVYLPGDISGLSNKLELLTAEFFAGKPCARCAFEVKKADKERIHGNHEQIMIVYRSRYAVRKYIRGGAGIVSSLGAKVAKYATRAMLTSAAKSALKGTLKTDQAALPALIGHKIMSTLKRKNDINKSSISGEPHSKKAAVGTTPNINALIDGPGIVLD